MWKVERERGGRFALVSLFVGVLLLGLTGMARAGDGPEIMVYKSPTCGCCEDWMKHLKKAGFTVKFEDRDDMNVVRAWQGVPQRLGSCHTAIVEGYIIEGHVPAEDIKRLLKEKLPVVGLSAPGMPQKSPGMQAGHKPPRDFDVLSFDAKGEIKLFKSY